MAGSTSQDPTEHRRRSIAMSGGSWQLELGAGHAGNQSSGSQIRSRGGGVYDGRRSSNGFVPDLAYGTIAYVVGLGGLVLLQTYILVRLVTISHVRVSHGRILFVASVTNAFDFYLDKIGPNVTWR